MKLLLDQNLSWRLADVVSRAFPGFAHVVSVALSGVSDEEIRGFAPTDEALMVIRHRP